VRTHLEEDIIFTDIFSFPAVGDSSVFLSTRIREIYERKECKEDDKKCTNMYHEINRTEFYISAPEHFELKVDHTMFAAKFHAEYGGNQYSESNMHMDGKLVDQSGKTVLHFPPRKPDRFPIKLLLEAALVDLDTLSQGVEGHEGEYLRDTGLVLYVTIKYSNAYDEDPTWWQYFLSAPMHYTYKVSYIPETEYRLFQMMDDPSPNQRLLRKRHGVYIKFLQTGTIGRFSFQALLINFVSGLGLVALTNTAIDLLALYVLPWSAYFGNYKYEEYVSPTMKHKKEN